MERFRLGFPDTPWHEASAAAVARVLEAHELDFDTVRLPTADLAGNLTSIDLFACAWLPDTYATLLQEGQHRPLGVLYRPAFIWCVCGAGPAAIGDLSRASSMDRRILVPASGPIAALARKVLEAYALGDAGFRIEQVSDQDAALWAQESDPSRVVPLCRPHQALHASALRELADPLAALGPPQEARLLLRDAARADLDPDLIDELDELTLGNKVVSAMAHAMQHDGMSAEAAADAWQRGKLTPRP